MPRYDNDAPSCMTVDIMSAAVAGEFPAFFEQPGHDLVAVGLQLASVSIRLYGRIRAGLSRFCAHMGVRYRSAASILPPSTVITAAVVFSAWAR